MLEPDEVSAILRLSELGWGSKRIARELGIGRNTVKGYIAAGGWTPYRQPQRKKALDGQESWLKERLGRHHGNADVIRQELAAERGIAVSLRTVERAVQRYRQELAAEARATVRFETPPGKQLQIDFGERLVEIGGSKVRVYLFVATLGYSRRSSIRSILGLGRWCRLSTASASPVRTIWSWCSPQGVTSSCRRGVKSGRRLTLRPCHTVQAAPAAVAHPAQPAGPYHSRQRSGIEGGALPLGRPTQLRSQQQRQRAWKLYSFNAPEVECIGRQGRRIKYNSEEVRSF